MTPVGNLLYFNGVDPAVGEARVPDRRHALGDGHGVRPPGHDRRRP